ncbi:OstA-like protein [Pustulibacterium marinum]|uniref:OstA-like protein n=1 Tax=Pustulibacterium marinum TaxID=1224947 RepID=A0A1I7G5E1_9FLAO|nr:OstA-like protein [Pustulibacterium marinum]SFU43643.1 OstA-like protein [Pustulibacterium marinum]
MNLKFYFSLFFICFLGAFSSNAQQKNTSEGKKKIQIIQGRNFHKDEEKFPGATIFNGDKQQVQFRHEGIDVWCDIAVYYQDDNFIKASGNVYLQQGDSVKMNCDYIEYNGNTKLAIAEDNVELRNNQMKLETNKLYFNRLLQQCYYNTSGTVTDPENTLTSQSGKYFIETEKFQFNSNVHLVNKDFDLKSNELDYYERSKHAYLYGPSTITGKDYVLYCERGYYDTTVEKGYGIKNTRIDYNQRIIKGDSLYFEKKKEFAAATNNIQIIDTVNKGIVKGHYGEVWKAKDSMFVTKRAVAINLVENDSIFIHGDTLMVTGKENERILRAFRDARIYKTGMSGKCDSIHSSEITGITQLIRKIPKGTKERDFLKYNPILWNGENQLTGDSIHLISNAKTEKLDSLKVLNNAFIAEKDSLGDGYNQVKGKNLYGLFNDANQLNEVHIVQNTESIFFAYDDSEFVGIDKAICSRIEIELADNQIVSVTNFTDTESTINREEDLPVNARKLPGFYWRGDERIKTKDDIFSEEDNNIELVKIQGIDDPQAIDMEEMGRVATQPTDGTEAFPTSETNKEDESPTTPKKESSPALKPKRPLIQVDSLKLKPVLKPQTSTHP